MGDCPFAHFTNCDEECDAVDGRDVFTFSCKICGGFKQSWESHFSSARLRPFDLGMVRELNDIYAKMPEVTWDNGIYCDTADGRKFVHPPHTMHERAVRLLSHLVRHSSGMMCSISRVDYPLVYSSGPSDTSMFIDYLERRGWIRCLARYSDGTDVQVQLEGYDFVQGRANPPLTVFISSTVYDLKDCRAALSKAIEENGDIVRLSDDPGRFDVDHQGNSIETCLRNIDNSDVVICIIDRYYGPRLPEQYLHKSATHVEIEYARKMEKPIIFFMRRDASMEYSALKKDPTSSTRWVEPSDPDRRHLWLEFVNWCVGLPTGQARHSNWYDQFETVVDLTKMVQGRLDRLRHNTPV